MKQTGIAIPRGYRLKDGKLVPCRKHLPANLRLQKAASKKIRADAREGQRQ